MLETLLATIGVMFTPMLSGSGGIGPLSLILNFSGIVGITVITNIIRALRACRDNNGNIKSYGILYGIMKGMLCGGVTMGLYIAVMIVPIFRVLLMAMGRIPLLGSMIDGLVLAFFYVLSYIYLASPLFGPC